MALKQSQTHKQRVLEARNMDYFVQLLILVILLEL